MPIFVAFTVLVLYAHRQGVPLPHGDARPLWRRQEIKCFPHGLSSFFEHGAVEALWFCGLRNPCPNAGTKGQYRTEGK
jgi:hypothetical protein